MSQATGGSGTLILSVGGSPQPLRTAIEGAKWDRVVFVVSDGSDGSASSRRQVEDAEIDYGGGGCGPGLRHLPACPKDIGITPVPPDDLDRALARIDAVLAAEVATGRSVTVDYTGGTKTMTAAMVLAGTGWEGVRLRFMAGRRQDLTAVVAGTEAPLEMPRDLLGAANLFALARAQVARRAYGPALGIVREIEKTFAKAQGAGTKPPASWRERCDDWQKWLTVLDAWDRFDFAKADNVLKSGLGQKKAWAAALEAAGCLGRLERLADEARNGPGPALCEDLWLNAERRAALRLYDDAIARLYRLAEAAVQARLHLRHGIPDTGRVPLARVPGPIAARGDVRRDAKTGEETVALPLFRALELLAHLDPADPLAAVWPHEGRRFGTPVWQAARNRSILAHGFRPASEDDWKTARNWFEDCRTALWEDLLGRPTADQLPDVLP